MRKLSIIPMLLTLFLSLSGFTFSPLKENAKLTPFTYNQLTLGDDLSKVLAQFGQPRYTEQDYQHQQKLTYYYYKDNSHIGINCDTNKVVDILIKSDYYATIHDPRLGDTRYKLDQIYGLGKKENLDGKLLYPYASGEKQLVFQLDPNTYAVESIRITTLPLTEDTLEYLPDDATDESLNPLIADKTIDISALNKFKPYRPAK